MYSSRTAANVASAQRQYATVKVMIKQQQLKQALSDNAMSVYSNVSAQRQDILGFKRKRSATILSIDFYKTRLRKKSQG
jgi:hypothetical protein